MRACRTIRKASRRLGGQSSPALATCAQTCITIDGWYMETRRMLHELNVQVNRNRTSRFQACRLCSSCHTSGSQRPADRPGAQ
jgi:hypothetical protein